MIQLYGYIKNLLRDKDSTITLRVIGLEAKLPVLKLFINLCTSTEMKKTSAHENHKSKQRNLVGEVSKQE